MDRETRINEALSPALLHRHKKNTMSSLTKFDTGHEDLIHDVAYDFYGKRLVTCSSDQRLKVWDFVEREDVSVWELSDSWKAHDSSILKGRWARPEYGQVIASCSFDRQVKIWEEQTTGD